MKNYILLLMISLLFFQCQGDEKRVKKHLDTIQKKRFNPKNENIKDIEESLIPIAEEFLKQCKDFTPLPYNEFRKQVKRVYGIDIDEYSDNIFPMSYKFIPDIILKEQRIVIDEMMIEDNTPNYFCEYNKLVFYEDEKMIHMFKKKWKEDLRHLVQRYGFHDNEMILSIGLSQIDFFSKSNLKELLFDFNGIDKKNTLRKQMFEKVYEYTDGDFQNVYLLDQIVLEPQRYNEPEKTLAFMMNTAIDRELPKWGLPEYIYDKYPEYLWKLEKANYYDHKVLKDYSTIVYGQTPKDDENPKPKYQRAVINDPDGYTNVRNIKGEIVFKIKENEEFMVSKEGKDLLFGNSYKEGWWYVSFKGEKGWIHNSRVTIIQE